MWRAFALNYPNSYNQLIIFPLFTGNFSSLTAIFHFKRDFGFYFLQEFIPTILVVALSWVGFWIDERSVPARVSLGITTVLAITTLIFGIQASMPRVGHVKAIDVFLLVSFLFVFAALVEYAIICTFSNVFSPRKEEALKQKHSQSKMNPSAILEECNDGTLYRIFKDKEEETRVSFCLSILIKNVSKIAKTRSFITAAGVKFPELTLGALGLRKHNKY